MGRLIVPLTKNDLSGVHCTCTGIASYITEVLKDAVILVPMVQCPTKIEDLPASFNDAA